MFFQTPSGVRIFYDQVGKGADLILIGGLSTHHGIWDAVLPALQKQFRVVRLDNRGSGQSDTPVNPFLIQDMAEDVIALMDHLRIKQAFIAGHSMGGAILQQLLVGHPKRIKKAMICASGARMPLPARVHIETSSHLRKQGVSESLILETVIPWIFGRTFIRSVKNVNEMVRTMLLDPWPPTAAGYDAQAHALMAFNLRGQLDQIDVKTLIITGDQDKLTSLASAKYMHRSILGSELAVIKRSGHMLQLECPDALVRLIIEFCMHSFVNVSRSAT